MELRVAVSADVPAIAALVERAYRVYLDRMDRRPRPMDDDYAGKVDRREVVVADDSGIVGLIVLERRADHVFIDNVAVDPARQGSGVGRTLLLYAEDQARRHGVAELRLYTNAVMTENIALYSRIGYVEVDRLVTDGFSRVVMTKRLT